MISERKVPERKRKMFEKITPEEAHEVAIEFVKKAWPGHEVLVCTHMDEPHLHSNIVVNPVNGEIKKYNIGEEPLITPICFLNVGIIQ